jgi:putative oxidoreductase
MTAPSAAVVDGSVSALSAGLLMARLVLGVPMIAHGAQKLLGWFGGYGLAGTGGFFEGLGFRPGRLYVASASLAEITSGVLITLGLLGPVGPALMISPMLVASLTVHKGNGFFAGGNGIEVPFLYAGGALALAFTGYGAFSLDALLGLERLAKPWLAFAAVTTGVLGGILALGLRQPVAKEAHS